jgi:hypothetical protein
VQPTAAAAARASCDGGRVSNQPAENGLAPPAVARPVDRRAIHAELEAARHALHDQLGHASAADLRRGSDGTRWTNEQLLFHMAFGYLVVRRLLPLVRLVSRLPAPAGRGFAAVLDAGRRPFHVVNYLGSCGGAVVFNHARLPRLCDRTIARLHRSLERETEQALERGMPFPTSWDPYFTPCMTLADVYHYGTVHFEHHRRQLTVEAE